MKAIDDLIDLGGGNINKMQNIVKGSLPTKNKNVKKTTKKK